MKPTTKNIVENCLQLITALIVISLIVINNVDIVLGQFHWQVRDSFDEIVKKIDRIDGENCKIVDRNHLFLPPSTVTHIPELKSLGIDPVFPNRTNLLHIHNMALSRAFYYR